MLKFSKPLYLVQHVCVSFIIPSSFFPLSGRSPSLFLAQAAWSLLYSTSFPFHKTTKTRWGGRQGKCCKQVKSIPSLWHLSCWGGEVLAFFQCVLCFFPFFFFKVLFSTFPFLLIWKQLTTKPASRALSPPISQAFLSFPFISFTPCNAWRRREKISSCCAFYIHVMPT